MVKKKETNKSDLHGEVFTSIKLVDQMLDDDYTEEDFKNPKGIWIEPSCGEGAFLVGMKNRLLKYHEKKIVIENMLYGIDITPGNVEKAIRNVYGSGDIIPATYDEWPDEYKRKGVIMLFKHKETVVKNIICADGLKFNFKFII